MSARSLFLLAALAAPLGAQDVPAASAPFRTYRPFGTLREQAALQQRWLERRLTTVLPALMRRRGVDMWVVPMREYNEDPVFSSLVAPTTFAARRRTIYVFFDRCAAAAAVPDRTPSAPDSAAAARAPAAAPADTGCVERLALGGSSQGGAYTAIRSTRPPSGPAGGRQEAQAELWGDEQWRALREVIVARAPRRIAVDISREFAFADGLSAGEHEGMSEALGPEWTRRFVTADELAVDFIAARLPDEEAAWRRMQAVAWGIIDTAFSRTVITPGVTRTSDVVWWMRQKVNDLGLGTWFQPSVSVQRRGATAEQLGDDPVIQRGDVLHCDFGITAMRLNTDTQHMAYVLRRGETAPPPGLVAALRASNRLQDIVVGELRPGRTGNEVLRASLARMRSDRLNGTVYSHPVGMHGHGAGPLIGLWDYQDGVPGRGDHRVIGGMWYSIELQATTPVPEWGGQPVRSAQEEDVIVHADGRVEWAHRRQTAWHLVR